ncbi:ABC transporter substrate-binding protein [Corynebacterium renale]|uniref:Iron complex transport system substrate-binding protein n=1 Tax=Corynebacterium renale TaxID=1724 RepID=A0A2A9DPA1_9CORY|nr:ABC transporter substrate-binding protein [Corynebacterium renale]PFG27750.1 iron complex transport system substrate-binding protein [Corynebacterium renale]SQI22138.1 ABC transporter substrate-binding protein [Corynebacterium renale]
MGIKHVLLTAAVIPALSLAACSQSDTTASTEASGDKQTITNCGFTMELEGPAQRAVTLRQGATETLLEMGLEDQMVGTSDLRTPVLEHNQAAFDSIPVLADGVPTIEQVMGADADAAISDRASYFTGQYAGTREELAEKGIVTFVSNTDCNKGKPAFDMLEQDYKELGQIFGKPEAADKLIEKQRAVIAENKDKIDGLEPVTMATIYSIYEGEIYSDGNMSTFQAVTDQLGQKNVFADVEDQRFSPGWEKFASLDPDWIVLGDLSTRGGPGDSPESKIEMLENNPATRNMKAVREGNYIVVPGAALDPSARSVEVLPLVADALKEAHK